MFGLNIKLVDLQISDFHAPECCFLWWHTEKTFSFWGRCPQTPTASFSSFFTFPQSHVCGLEDSHICKNLTMNGETERYIWVCRRRRNTLQINAHLLYGTGTGVMMNHHVWTRVADSWSSHMVFWTPVSQLWPVTSLKCSFIWQDLQVNEDGYHDGFSGESNFNKAKDSLKRSTKKLFRFPLTAGFPEFPNSVGHS